MDKQTNNPEKEGHTKEWQDRARVVSDTKNAVNLPASPNQSPGEIEDVEEKSENLDKETGRETSY